MKFINFEMKREFRRAIFLELLSTDKANFVKLIQDCVQRWHHVKSQFHLIQDVYHDVCMSRFRSRSI